ncbi:MAG: hypothetical protein F6K22_29360 [Okeania sp. SIO2F4]|uniref:hypothetical protein n=1 Tax=Okeania sp. SIO2F4 TaxID=2607790 RepID=UPI00142AA5E3|nr:hypothetical protein [Okeania sp. SIO2F4]NES06565.1 hypothetical protein [Okeania sp. SIO2F4]
MENSETIYIYQSGKICLCQRYLSQLDFDILRQISQFSAKLRKWKIFILSIFKNRKKFTFARDISPN